MTREELDRLRGIVAAATKGPWSWYGDTRLHQCYLATVDRGRQFVMLFRRWGMGGAAPEFQVGGIMEPVAKLVEYEVPYRKDFHQINHPDAILIAEAPTALASALDEVEASWKREEVLCESRSEQAAISVLVGHDLDDAMVECQEKRAELDAANDKIERFSATLREALLVLQEADKVCMSEGIGPAFEPIYARIGELLGEPPLESEAQSCEAARKSWVAGR